MQKVMSIFAQNLAYYNEGEIVGDWLNLPQSPEVIDKYLKDIVKVDEEHEEYEIADVENIAPFPYDSIQWASVKELNNLAIIFGSLNEPQKEAITTHLISIGEEHYAIEELINICLQADEINYIQYYFDGIEYNKDCSPELKMGYTMAEENGIYSKLDKLDVTSYFDFERYGESFSYSYELSENGYLIPNYTLDLDKYSKEDIEQKINEIIQENIKEREVREIEI